TSLKPRISVQKRCDSSMSRTLITRWLTPLGVIASAGISGLIGVVPSAIASSPLQGFLEYRGLSCGLPINPNQRLKPAMAGSIVCLGWKADAAEAPADDRVAPEAAGPASRDQTGKIDPEEPFHRPRGCADIDVYSTATLNWCPGAKVAAKRGRRSRRAV